MIENAGLSLIDWMVEQAFYGAILLCLAVFLLPVWLRIYFSRKTLDKS